MRYLTASPEINFSAAQTVPNRVGVHPTVLVRQPGGPSRAHFSLIGSLAT
jgi:hypothetical protein